MHQSAICLYFFSASVRDFFSIYLLSFLSLCTYICRSKHKFSSCLLSQICSKSSILYDSAARAHSHNFFSVYFYWNLLSVTTSISKISTNFVLSSLFFSLSLSTTEEEKMYYCHLVVHNSNVIKKKKKNNQTESDSINGSIYTPSLHSTRKDTHLYFISFGEMIYCTGWLDGKRKKLHEKKSNEHNRSTRWTKKLNKFGQFPNWDWYESHTHGKSLIFDRIRRENDTRKNFKIHYICYERNFVYTVVGFFSLFFFCLVFWFCAFRWTKRNETTLTKI